jgi:hypothetical protein
MQVRTVVGVVGVVAALVLSFVGAGPTQPQVAAAPGCAASLDAGDLNAVFAQPGVGATAGAEGYGGGDYPHAFPLPDGRVLWMFQDMYFGNTNRLAATNAVHNGAIVQDGACWTIQGSQGRDFIGDALTDDSRRWFWPLDAEVGSDGNLWVFMAEMENPNGNGAALGVRPVRTWRAVLDPSTLAQIDFGPARNDSAQLYGQSIVSTDAWTYLYGNCYRQFVGAPVGPSEFDPCMRNSYVARVPVRQLDAAPQYWNGSAWVGDAAAARPVLTRGSNANLMNVQWFGDHFVNASKHDEWWGAEIQIDTAPTASGPWTTVDTINVINDRKCNRCGIYGLFLMPWLDTDGDMTIAVANGTDFASWRANAFLYRPTFYKRPVPDVTTPLAAATPPTFAVGDDRSGFVAVDPERLLDTREAGGAFGRLSGDVVYELDVSETAPSDATAVALNLATTATERTGFLRAFPCSGAEPETSTINPLGGENVSNAAIVPLGDGRVCFRSNVDTDLVVDLNGWFTPSSTVGLATITPRRLFDSRTGDGGGRLSGGTTVEVRALSSGSNATAVSLSVTASKPAGVGFVTAWPCGTEMPLVANLNTTGGVTRPNLVNVRVGGGGAVCLFSAGETDLVVDVLGEYREGSPSRYTPVGPVRIRDTRTDGHRPHSSNLAELVPLGDVDAAQANLTAVRTSGAGYLTGYSCLTEAWPGTANVNFAPRDTATTLALVTPSAGYACVFSSVPTEVVVDLYGVWRS